MIRTKITPNAFTLIELILTISLLAISFGVTTDILISLVRSQSRMQMQNTVEEQANFVGSKLEKELRDSSDVSSDDPLSITMVRRVDNEIITYFLDSSNNVLKRSIGTGAATVTEVMTDLTDPGGVIVNCPQDEDGNQICFTVSDNSPRVVNISMSFLPVKTGSSLSSGSGISSTDINETFVIRTSY